MRNKDNRLKIRHKRTRKKVIGSSERPRLSIHKSLRNIQAQIIDDSSGKVLVSASTLSKDFQEKSKNRGNIKASAQLGSILAEKAKQKGVTKICFDRSGYIYHGRVKAFAEAARKAGLDF